MLDLEARNGLVVQQDVMTSSKYYGDDAGAFKTMTNIVDVLERVGFEVLRKKIESEPSHHGAPQSAGEPMPERCYFESHVAFLVQENKNVLQEIAERNCAHVSRNPFKKTEQGMIILVTLRDYVNPFSVFITQVERLLADAARYGFTPHKKVEVEFAVYDSNTMHDISWLT
ncbi:MAG: hypothetical protein WCG20_03525 [bacterium]